MKILIYGAGVIGTVYAARLREGGHQVVILARGERLEDIRRYGLVTEDWLSGSQSTTEVEITEKLLPDDRYDVAMIMVRRDQLDSVLPDLSANPHIPTILFMMNHPVGFLHLVQVLGQDRVLLGFPGVGGAREGYLVRYALIDQQPTTIGEWGGSPTERVSRMAEIFRASGFPTRVSGDMDAWLKTHAFFVTAVCGAIYLCGGDCLRLSEDEAALGLMTDGVREGFAVVRALGLTVTPFSLKLLFCHLPRVFAIYYWRRFFASRPRRFTGDAGNSQRLQNADGKGGYGNFRVIPSL
jgi:2-dehydropantoate 2-reductase